MMRGRSDLFPAILLALFLVLAPLFRAGKVPLALMTFELLAILVFASVCLMPEWRSKLKRSEWLCLLAILVLPALQLLPIPGLTAASLPGQSDYYLALQVAQSQLSAATISVLSRDTWHALLVLFVPLSVFMLVRITGTVVLSRLVYLLFFVAAFEAALGLSQFGTSPSKVWYLGMEYTHFGSAVGTYTSRNNFVGLMYLSLMLALALYMATLGRHRSTYVFNTWNERLRYFASAEGHRAFVFGALCLLLLLAVIFSRSRAGIAVTMLGLLLSSLVFARRIGGNNVYGLTGSVVTVVFALSVVIGLGPVLNRFSAHDAVSDERWGIYQGALEAIVQYFPLGSGLGTFQHTYPAFQSLTHASYTINRVHNSFLEWLYTGGLLAAVLVLVLTLVYLRKWFVVWRRGAWGKFRYLQVGAGIGILLMLLHELVDYNLFVPANMIYFAFLAGIFSYPYEEASASDRRRSKTQRTRVIPPEKGVLSPPAIQGDGAIRSPFTDED